MKKLFLLLLLCAICVSVYALDGIPSAAEPRPRTDLIEGLYASEMEIGDTATLLATGQGYVTIRNVDATDNLYFGPSDVTATSGMLLKPGELATVGLGRNVELYGIATGTATATTRVFGGI